MGVLPRAMGIAFMAAVCGLSGCGRGPVESRELKVREATARGAYEVLDSLADAEMLMVVTGPLDGYIEPCGCSQGKVGGLIRRFAFIERLRQRNRPLSVVNLGSAIGDVGLKRGGIEQSQIKYAYILKALALMQYDVLALSGSDMKLGLDAVLGIIGKTLGQKTSVILGNRREEDNWGTRVTSSVLLAASGVRVGVTSVVDPGLVAGLAEDDKRRMAGSDGGCEQVVAKILAELELTSDYQVLLVDGAFDFSRQLAEMNRGFEVVVTSAEFPGPRSRNQMILNDGRTWLVNTGRGGMNVGVLEFRRGERSDAQPQFHLFALNDQYDGSASPIQALIRDQYRGALEQAKVVERFPSEAPPGPAGAVYLGAAACAECHPNTYKRWASSKHARAFAALRDDPKPKTVFDAECVSCHTTGFGYESGWRSDQATAHLAGNQCENCHGPGSKHAAAPGNWEFRKAMAGRNAGAALCLGCHDRDNSPGFEFASYWGQIVHKGLDDYRDPGSRQPAQK